MQPHCCSMLDIRRHNVKEKKEITRLNRSSTKGNSPPPCSNSFTIEAFSPSPDSVSCWSLTWEMRESRELGTTPVEPLSRFLLDYKSLSINVNSFSSTTFTNHMLVLQLLWTNKKIMYYNLFDTWNESVCFIYLVMTIHNNGFLQPPYLVCFETYLQ